MIRKVYDEPNPFIPEIKRKRKSVDQPSTSKSVKIDPKNKAIPPEQRVKMRLQAVDAYTRHKMMINNYVAYYRGSSAQKLQRDTSNDKNDFDIIRENHRFLWSDNDLAEAEKDWGARLAKRYYEKLFKEYCIVDLTHYKRNIYAMRWRTEKELFSGKGQFECGDKHCRKNDQKSGGGGGGILSSWEVNFAYTENEIRKNALVKVRLCAECSAKLNYHSQKRLVRKEKKKTFKLKREEELRSEDGEEEEEILQNKSILQKRIMKRGARREKRKNEKEKEGEGKREKRGGGGEGERFLSDSFSSSSDDEEGEKEKEEEEVGEKKLTEEEKRSIDEEVKKNKEEARSASEIWSSKTAVQEAEKTADDEFDEFIDDLLM